MTKSMQVSLLSVAVAALLSGCEGRAPGNNASNDHIKAGAGVDKMTNEPWATINIDASDANLTLWVQCDGNAATVGLKSSTQLTSSSGMSVLVKFRDDQSAASEMWATTTDHKGAVRNADTDAFIRRMIASPTVQLRVTPLGSDVIDATFSTKSFAQKLAQYGDHCSWSQLLRPEQAASQ